MDNDPATIMAYARVYAAAYSSSAVHFNGEPWVRPETARNNAETAVHHFAGVMKDLKNG